MKLRKQEAVGLSGNLQNAEDVLGVMFERGLLGDHAGRRFRAGRKFGDMRRYLFGPMFAGETTLAKVQAGNGRDLQADPFDPDVAEREEKRELDYRLACRALTLAEHRVIVDLCHLNRVPLWVAPVSGGSPVGLTQLVERQRLFSGLDSLAREFGFDD